MERETNALQVSYKIYNFILTVSPHYLIKSFLNSKHIKRTHFEVKCHAHVAYILLLSRRKNEYTS